MNNEQNNETPRWDDIKLKIWLKNTGAKIKAAPGAVLDWCLENPIKASMALGAATSLVSKCSRMYVTHAEDVRRNTDFYDTRRGTHTHIKRKLRPSEQVEVDERYSDGESYVSIFNDLGLLK